MFIINAEYEMFYKLESGKSHPDEGKPFTVQCMDRIHHNDIF